MLWDFLGPSLRPRSRRIAFSILLWDFSIAVGSLSPNYGAASSDLWYGILRSVVPIEAEPVANITQILISSCSLDGKRRGLVQYLKAGAVPPTTILTILQRRRAKRALARARAERASGAQRSERAERAEQTLFCRGVPYSPLFFSCSFPLLLFIFYFLYLKVSFFFYVYFFFSFLLSFS